MWDNLLVINILVVETGIEVLSMGDFKPDRTLRPMERLTKCTEYALCRRGRFQRRAQPPIALHAVTCLHIAISLSIILYPFLAPKTYDGIFLVTLLAVGLHWMLFKGECILSYVEKRMFYSDYNMGDAPVHQWWCDQLSIGAVLTVIWVFMLGVNISIMLVLLRNITLRGDGLSFALSFGKRRTIWAAFTMGTRTLGAHNKMFR